MKFAPCDSFENLAATDMSDFGNGESHPIAKRFPNGFGLVEVMKKWERFSIAEVTGGSKLKSPKGNCGASLPVFLIPWRYGCEFRRLPWGRPR